MLNILIRKIISLAIIMAVGFGLVRWGPLTDQDTRSLSKLNCILIMPCNIFGAFQMHRTPEVISGLLLVLLAAVLVHGLYLLLTALLRRPLKLTPGEQASAFCTNAGNLIIPLVTAMLGSQWVIYTSAFILVQTILLWSHAKNLICGNRGMDWKGLLGNPNVLAILAGVLLFLVDRPLTGLVRETVSSVGSMIGPSAMLVIGMTMGSMNLKSALGDPRVWLVTGLRLLLLPLCALGLLKALCLVFPAGAPYFLVTMLAASAPAAAVITHICQIYDRDPAHPSAICALSTALCVLTIPLMIRLYMLVCL